MDETYQAGMHAALTKLGQGGLVGRLSQAWRAASPVAQHTLAGAGLGAGAGALLGDDVQLGNILSGAALGAGAGAGAYGARRALGNVAQRRSLAATTAPSRALPAPAAPTTAPTPPAPITTTAEGVQVLPRRPQLNTAPTQPSTPQLNAPTPPRALLPERVSASGSSTAPRSLGTPPANASPAELAQWRDLNDAHARLDLYLGTGGRHGGIYPSGVTPSAQEYDLFRRAGIDLHALR